MFDQKIINDLKTAIKTLGFGETKIQLSIPETIEFGDYSTNIALQLSKQEGKKTYHSPHEIASDIVEKLNHPEYLERVETAGPGFIYFYIKDSYLIKNLEGIKSRKVSPHAQKRMLVEYAHPNTHKAFHIGHLRNIILGESLARLLEDYGHDIFRANYQGDIGLHVAKAIWGIKKLGVPEESLGVKEKAEFLGRAYATGAQAYEAEEEAKQEIVEINKALYRKDPEIIEIWKTTRQWSLDYFDLIYKRLGSKFDRLFFESETESLGKEIVQKHLGRVFEEDQGAIIFPGKKYGLHNRVFITSAGNPTYEAKDMGLGFIEIDTFPFDLAIHVVASEQAGYFQVIFKALELIDPKFTGKEVHLSYGMVNLISGKMSSRTGQVITAEGLIESVKSKVAEVMKESRLDAPDEVVEKVAIGAIKFSMLKYSPSSDIAFDIEQSVSLQGDSGPYLQYTYARTRSVLRNVRGLKIEDSTLRMEDREIDLDPEERAVLRLLEYFPLIVEKSAIELSPTALTEYLLELSRAFNVFYQNCPILKSDKAVLRVQLTKVVGDTIEKGLYLLGIEAPERM